MPFLSRTRIHAIPWLSTVEVGDQGNEAVVWLFNIKLGFPLSTVGFWEESRSAQPHSLKRKAGSTFPREEYPHK